MFIRHWQKTAMCLVAGLTVAAPSAFCRDQWSINHGATNPPVDPRFQPGGQWSGYVKSFQPDFWKGQLANRVPVGTVLTAILEDDLSSGKNKPGDTFTLTLQDGFVINDRQLIPPNSKIIGTVVSASSAKTKKAGAPGELQISLQSLVFPDGSHVPIYAFIDSNPNLTHKQPLKVRHLGTSIADYGESLAAMAFSFVSGPGFMMAKMNRGLDFRLDKGEALPVRLNRSLDVPQSVADSQSRLVAQPPAGTTAGGNSQIPYPPQANSVPGLVDPQGPIVVPPSTTQAPAITNYPPVAPAIGAAPATQTYRDPNSVFNQPLQGNSLNGMPDPF